MKTTLNQSKLIDRKRAAITATFLLAAVLPMAGCEEAPPVYQPEEIAQLDGHMDSTLVEGRDGCIKALVDAGKTANEAAKICDDATAQAQATAPKSTPAATTGTVTTHDSSGSNAMLWYLIGRNSSTPAVYSGSPSVGFQSYGSASTGGGGTATLAAPAKLSPVQAEYLKAPMASRSSISAKLAAVPGTKMSAVRSSSRGYSTSRGGFSSSSGIGRGG